MIFIKKIFRIHSYSKSLNKKEYNHHCLYQTLRYNQEYLNHLYLYLNIRQISI